MISGRTHEVRRRGRGPRVQVGGARRPQAAHAARRAAQRAQHARLARLAHRTAVLVAEPPAQLRKCHQFG